MGVKRKVIADVYKLKDTVTKAKVEVKKVEKAKVEVYLKKISSELNDIKNVTAEDY